MLQRKVCLYVRVSTDNQQGGLESQIRALKGWCFRNQITEYELYTDEGISGAKESRPSLNRLIELVEQNRVEQVSEPFYWRCPQKSFQVAANCQNQGILG